MLMRADALSRLEKRKQADVEQFLTFAFHPRTQKGLELYLASLKQRS